MITEGALSGITCAAVTCLGISAILYKLGYCPCNKQDSEHKRSDIDENTRLLLKYPPLYRTHRHHQNNEPASSVLDSTITEQPRRVVPKQYNRRASCSF